MTPVQETSRNVYADIKEKGWMYSHQEKIGLLLQFMPELTNREIAFNIDVPASSVSARRNELIDRGYVEERPKRVCTLGNYKVLTWRLTEAGYKWIRRIKKRKGA